MRGSICYVIASILSNLNGVLTMTRKLLAVLFLCVLCSAAWDQTNQPRPQPPGTTRVAVVNIAHVFNGYSRAMYHRGALTKKIADMETRWSKLRDEMTAWQKALDKLDATDEQVQKLRDAIAKNQKEADEVKTKSQEERMVVLWNDVQGAINTYAAEHKIDLVLGYGEPLEKTMIDSFPNVRRKMEAMDTGGVVPLFVRQGVDISHEVVVRLNNKTNSKSP
jgi:Skp family chaperone for outer membrane proteins